MIKLKKLWPSYRLMMMETEKKTYRMLMIIIIKKKYCQIDLFIRCRYMDL